MDEKVSVIIPVFNEEGRIEATLLGIIDLDMVGQIIVVDDASTDNTIEKVNKYKNDKINIIQLHRNKGKGAALRIGLKKADYPYIIFLDGDVGKTSKEIIKLVKPLFSNEADVTIGMLPPALKKGGFGLVKFLSRRGVYWLTGIYLKSILSGQRGFRKEVLQKVPIPDRFGVEFGMTIDIIRQGFCIKEIPVKMTHHETERNVSDFYHRGKQFRDIFVVLIKKIIGTMFYKLSDEGYNRR